MTLAAPAALAWSMGSSSMTSSPRLATAASSGRGSWSIYPPGLGRLEGGILLALCGAYLAVAVGDLAV